MENEGDNVELLPSIWATSGLWRGVAADKFRMRSSNADSAKVFVESSFLSWCSTFEDPEIVFLTSWGMRNLIEISNHKSIDIWLENNR